MSKLSLPEADEADVKEARKPSRLLTFLPYLLILILTLVGVAYTSINRAPLVVYWQVVAIIIGILCIVSGWPNVGKEGRVRLIWTQVLHWAAFLGAMNLVLYSDVSRLLNADSMGLAVLLLLALGTFVAGVHTLSWQTGLLGLVMALAAPALAWIEESALLLMLIALAFVVLAGVFWWFGRSRRSAGPLPA